MEGLSPVDSSGSSVSDDASTNSQNSTSSNDISTQDTLQSISSQSLSIQGSSTPMSLLSFMNLIGATSNDLQETLKLSTQSNLSSRIPFYLAASNATASEKYVAFLFYYSTATIVIDSNENSINSLNTSLNDYNTNVSADLSAVDTMNQAIHDFQNGDIDQTTYNLAVATYNQYAADHATRVSEANDAIEAFNSAINDNNNTINTINGNLPPGGIPLNPQTTYSTKTPLPIIATSPPMPTSTISFTETSLTATDSNNVVKISLAVLLLTATSTFIVEMANDALLMMMLKNADRFFTYQIFYLAGKQLNLSAAYTLPANKINVTDPGTAGGAGSSVALATIASSISNPNVNDILGHSIYISELEEIYLKNNFSSLGESTLSKLALTLEISTSNLVSQMGLFSINTAIRLLGGDGAVASIDPRSSLAKVALSLGLLNELKETISAGVFKNSILEMIKSQDGTLSEDELNKKTAELISSIELKILLLGVLNLAIALESPKLTGQLLGATKETNALSSFNDILNESGNLELLRSSISSQTNLSPADSLEVINSSISEENIDAATFQNNLKDALLKHNVNVDIATNASENVVTALHIKVSEDFLKATVITKESIIGTPLDSQGIHAILEQNNGKLSAFSLRDKLAIELESEGFKSSEAIDTATSLISTIHLSVYKTSQSRLEDQLNLTLSKLEKDNSRDASHIIGGELAAMLFKGNNSVLELVSERIKTIKKTENREVDAKLDEVFKKFITSDLITLGLAKILGDPATNLLYLASGIIYSEDESPSKPASLNREHLASIDIPI